MGSVQTDQTTFTSVELHQLHHQDLTNERVERAQWVLKSPEPPGPGQQLLHSIKANLFPQRKKYSAVSFFKGLFPILSWGRHYKASKFKNDLMAGLTLASLSIPQVINSQV
jgi:low affinity sulfate transporter 2